MTETLNPMDTPLLNRSLGVQLEREVHDLKKNYIGRSVLRTEDPRYLMGRARYTDDIHLPGMLHAAFLRSPHPHARIKRIDTSRAKALEGVEALITGSDLADLGPYVTTLDRPEVKTVSRPILNPDKVMYVGQPVAIAVADSRYVAEDAVDLIDIDWEPLPPVVDPEKALEPGSPLIWEELGDNNFAHVEFKRGDVEGAFERAAHVFRKRFHSGRFMAAPLETRGVIADFDASTGTLTVWSSTQMPHMVRTFTPGPLGIPESKIRVIADNVGGGFGMKAHIFDEEALIPAASRIVGAPVKWIEDRSEELAASSHAKEQIITLEMAVAEDGTLLAFRGHYIGVGGAWPAHPWTSLIECVPSAALAPSIYAIQAIETAADAPLTNRCPIGAYRAIGWTAGHHARETMIDDVAKALDIDPIEFRLKNCIPDEPYVSATGMKYDGGTYRASIEKVKEMLDYPKLREEQKRLRDEGRYIGIGWSPYVEPAAWGSEISKANGIPAEFFDAASVTIEPDGSVTVTTGCHNHGQAHETTLAQIAADSLGVPFDSIRVIENDTERAVYGTGTYAARTAVVAGGAIIRAGREVRDKVVRLAAHAMEVSPEDIEISEGVASVKGVPDQKMTIGELALRAYYGGENRPTDAEPALTSTRSYDPPENYSNGTIAAVVEVDVETGHYQLRNIYACEDCGVMLNPMVVDGQVHGGITQGIGGALFEELVYDEDGQFLSSTLMDYLYPSTTEVPHIEVSHFETPSTETEGGIKGMAESGRSLRGPRA